MEDKHTPTSAVKMLKSYDSTASPKNIHHYQQKIGSINYTAIATRPDVAKVASHLAMFMMNPGSEHFDAANQVLAYLNYMQKVEIKYSAVTADTAESFNCFITSSDIMYDDHLDHHSSKNYLAILYESSIN